MKGFCEECRDYVEYSIIEEKQTKDIKGKILEYRAQIAQCRRCNSKLFISELRDQNLQSLGRAYRELK